MTIIELIAERDALRIRAEKAEVAFSAMEDARDQAFGRGVHWEEQARKAEAELETLRQAERYFAKHHSWGDEKRKAGAMLENLVCEKDSEE